MPFGGAVASKRVIPVISLEAVESQKLSSIAQGRMCRQPNFNRAPRGWGIDYCPESNELWKWADKQKTEALTYACSSFYKDDPVNHQALQGRGKNTPAWYIKWFISAEWFSQQLKVLWNQFINHSRVEDSWAEQFYTCILFINPSSLPLPPPPPVVSFFIRTIVRGNSARTQELNQHKY